MVGNDNLISEKKYHKEPEKNILTNFMRHNYFGILMLNSESKIE